MAVLTKLPNDNGAGGEVEVESTELEAQEVFIGRMSGCQVCLEDDNACPVHARVFNEGPSYFIEDLRSKAGTNINGNRIYERQALQEGDIITIGHSSLAFTLDRIQAPDTVILFTERARAIADSNGSAASPPKTASPPPSTPLPKKAPGANAPLRARAAPSPPPPPASPANTGQLTGYISGPMPARRTGALNTTTTHLPPAQGGLSSITNAILRNRYYQYGESPPQVKELNTIWFILAIVLACICFALGGLLVYLA